MASNLKDFLQNKRIKHTVGQVNSYEFETLINGAVCLEDVDNFVMGELEYKEVDGELVAGVKKATAGVKAHDAVLLVTPEVRISKGEFQELLSDFYNGKGERATCALLKPGFTFETSAFDATDVSGTAKVGHYAVWDAVGSKFKLKATTDDSEVKLFRVVEVTTDVNYSIDDEKMVMLQTLR